MTDLTLSPQLSHVYQFIKTYQATNDGRFPTQDEIAEGLGKGRATIRYHLLRLQNKGYLSDMGGHRTSVLLIK